MNENKPFGSEALQLLELACRRKSNSSRLAWILSTAGLGLGALLLAALLDYWLVLPVLLRAVAALLVLAAAGFGFLNLYRALRRKPPLKEAALDLEQEHPAAGCTLSTAAEYLSGERKPNQAYEPELAASLAAQAANFLKAWQVPYWRQVWIPALLVAGVSLLLLAFLGVTCCGWTAIERIAKPLSPIAYTSLQVDPGNAEIPIGKDFNVNCAFKGRLPKRAGLYWRENQKQPWKLAKLNLDGQASAFSFPAVRQPFDYYVSGGDARSPEYRVQIFSPPEIKKLSINVQLPAYTARPPQHFDTADFTALRASKATFAVTPSVPISRAQLRFSKGSPLALAPAKDGTWSAVKELRNDEDYWIELYDQKNRLGSNDKPYSLQVLPDEPPKIDVVQPGMDIRADANQKVALKIHASDDYGLQEWRLVYNKLGQPEKVLPLTLPRSSTNNCPLLEADGQTGLPLAELGLKDYELVAYHAEAVDNNTLDGPGVGKSPVYFVEITDKEGNVCLSQCNCAKVNLLVIQKQIIADTTALRESASADAYKELADRETEATDFARIYRDGMAQMGAPRAASSEMEQAIDELNQAEEQLSQRHRSPAIPPEERALAHFYQVIKLLPELEDLPTTPPPALAHSSSQSPKLNVVLEEIKKRKKNQPDNRELAELLRQLQRLTQSQTALAQGAQSLWNSQQANSVQAGSAESPNQDLKPFAEQQDAFNRDAQALQEKLAKLAGHDHRLGHDIPSAMSTASKKLGSASSAFQQGNLHSGYSYSLEGAYALGTVSALLERYLHDDNILADTSAEQYPKEYEKAIDAYLQQLSRQ